MFQRKMHEESDDPLVEDVMRELYRFADKWDMIAALLNIDVGQVRMSQIDRYCDLLSAIACLRQVLSMWVHRKRPLLPSKAWVVIAEVVEALGEKSFELVGFSMGFNFIQLTYRELQMHSNILPLISTLHWEFLEETTKVFFC